MLLFRSLTIGLLGACVLLLARVDGAAHKVPVVHIAAVAPPVAVSSATIVDVAPGVRGEAVSSLIRLSAGERVVAVDDRAVDSDLAAGVAISAHAASAGGFVDLEVVSEGGVHRRVLVLLH